jgi:hypothetical protein
VFLHGGKRHVVVRGEFGHGRVGVHDPRQDVAPRSIAERPKQLVQDVRRWLSTCNHLVVDYSTGGTSRTLAQKVRRDPGRHAGVRPPVPAFYTHPESVQDIVDRALGRALDYFL